MFIVKHLLLIFLHDAKNKFDILFASMVRIFDITSIYFTCISSGWANLKVFFFLIGV